MILGNFLDKMLLGGKSFGRQASKTICQLISEMEWFSWWVADAECTPMHGLYQELGDIVTALVCLFYGPDEKYNDIEPFLDKL